MPLPAGFRFGVATSAFQSEGGFNGPGQPANNWAGWELAGRAARSGRALDLWERYPDHLDRVAAMGCNAFRLSVDWTRCEPTPGSFDEGAFARYAAILDACRARGLEPVVALHHFAHPRWLGPDFWLRLNAPERFGAWADAAASRLADRCRYWLTINEPNDLPFASFVTGSFPPGRRLRVGDAVRAAGHVLTAHVLAYRALHRIRPDAVVSTNTHALSVYELDRLFLDLLVAPGRGIDRRHLRAWLADRRADYHASLAPPSGLERAARAAAAAAVPLDAAFPRAVAAVYGEPAAPCLDLVALSCYDPAITGRLRRPGRRTVGGRDWSPLRQPWEDAVDPAAMATHLRLHHEPGLDVWVAETGLCNRVTADGRVWARLDGWDRVRHLRATLGAVEAAVAAGVPVTGYFHWTLADNYEWGSYEHRFGLHRADQDRGGGPARWHPDDAFGADAAGAYRALVRDLRRGDGASPRQADGEVRRPAAAST